MMWVRKRGLFIRLVRNVPNCKKNSRTKKIKKSYVLICVYSYESLAIDGVSLYGSSFPISACKYWTQP